MAAPRGLPRDATFRVERSGPLDVRARRGWRRLFFAVVGSPDAFTDDAGGDGAFLDLLSEDAPGSRLLSRHRLLCFEDGRCLALVPEHCAWLLGGVARPVGEAEREDFERAARDPGTAAPPLDAGRDAGADDGTFAVVCTGRTLLLRVPDGDAEARDRWVGVLDAALRGRAYVFAAVSGSAGRRRDAVLQFPEAAGAHAHGGYLRKKNRRTRFWNTKYYTIDVRAGDLCRWEPAKGQAAVAGAGGAPDRRYPLADCTVLDPDPMGGGGANAFCVAGASLPGGGRTLHFEASSPEDKRRWVHHLCTVSRIAHEREFADDARWTEAAAAVARAGGGSKAAAAVWPLLCEDRPMSAALRFSLWRAFTGFDAFDEAHPGFGDRVLLQFQRERPGWAGEVFDFFRARVPRVGGGGGGGGDEDEDDDDDPHQLLADGADDSDDNNDNNNNDQLPVPLQYREPHDSFSLDPESKQQQPPPPVLRGGDDQEEDDEDRQTVQRLVARDLGVGLHHEDQMKLKLLMLALQVNNPDVERCPMLLRLGSLLMPLLGEAEYYTFLQHLLSVSRSAARGARTYVLATPRQSVALYLVFRALLARDFGEASAAAGPSLFAWWREWTEEVWCASCPPLTRSRFLDLFMIEGDAAFVRTALAVVSLRASALGAARDEHDWVRRLGAACRDMHDVPRVMGAVRALAATAAQVAELRRDRDVVQAPVPAAWTAPACPPLSLAHYAWAERLGAASSVLRHPEEQLVAGAMGDALRRQVAHLEPRRVYDMLEHGHGLEAMYRRAAAHARERGAPTLCVLLVRTLGGAAFGVALSDLPAPAPAAYGSPVCAAFRVRPLRLAAAGEWRDGAGAPIHAAEAGLGIGASRDGLGYALHLDRDMRRGTSLASDGFGTPPLAGAVDFEVAEVELLAFHSGAAA